MKELKFDDFKQEIQKDKLTVVDFWAPWCSFCLNIADDYAAISKKYADKFNFCKLNVDEAEDIALQYGVNFIPSFIVFSKGEVVLKCLSETNASHLEKSLLKLIENNN